MVDDANNVSGINISAKTVSKMMRKGLIGVSPSKLGPARDFLKAAWDAMKLAFVTYFQLEQAQSKVQLTVKQISLRVNQMVRAVSRPVVRPADGTHARFITNGYLQMTHGRG